MLKALKWISSLIAVGVAIFVVLFLISINYDEKAIEITPLQKTKKIVIEKPKQVWLNHFSQAKKKDYFFPVTEILVQLDLNKKMKIKTIYKFSTSQLDPYQLFCLNEEFKQHKLRYYLKKDKRGVEILIYSQDKKKLDILVQSLKNYNISAKVSLFKKG